MTDGNGNVITYTYDALDRVTKIAYSGGTTITYSYDDDSNLLTETDNTGSTVFTYDVLNRLKTKTLPGGTVITTGYDATGNLTTFNDGGGVVTYTYDAANRMKKLTEPGGTQTTYGYDNADRKTLIQYPNGTGMRMTYDGAGHELTTIGGTMDGNGNILTTYSSFSYHYLSGSTPTAVLQTVDLLDPVTHGATYHRAYTYDSQNRLKIADVTQGSTEIEKWTYGYDDAGNRTSYSRLSTGESITYSYNAASPL